MTTPEKAAYVPEAFAEIPTCDCPVDDDLGARLHREGCVRAAWFDAEARRRRLYG